MKARKVSSLTSKGQTTIPREIRRRLKLNAGDSIVFEIDEKDRVTLKRAESADNEWLKSLEMTLAPEWASDDDDDL